MRIKCFQFVGLLAGNFFHFCYWDYRQLPKMCLKIRKCHRQDLLSHRGWGWGKYFYKPSFNFLEMAHTHFSSIRKTACQPLIWTKRSKFWFRKFKHQISTLQELKIASLLWKSSFWKQKSNNISAAGAFHNKMYKQACVYKQGLCFLQKHEGGN